MSIVGLYDDIFLAHHEWRHPERPERLQAVRRVLQESGLMDEMRWPPIPALPADAVTAVHDGTLWRQLQRLSAQGGGRFDADTYVNAFSFEAACTAASAAIEAARSALEGANGAVALVRPPGHHATIQRAMGFCLFNNAAVAARYALDHLDVQRVFILDWDVHHGNGTQDIFYEEPHVFFASIHQFPFYPGTGHWEQIGRAGGRGTTLNVPLLPGHGDANYLQIMDELILPALVAFQPDLVLLSAGFDAHWRDPLAGMRLTIGGYYQMARRLRTAADRVDAPVAMLLEGGYDLDAVGHGLAASMKGLLGRPQVADPLGPPPDGEGEPPIAPLLARIAAHHPILGGDG